jgi:hypothetical protein
LTKLKGISTDRAPSMNEQKVCFMGKFTSVVTKKTETFTRNFKTKEEEEEEKNSAG